MKRTARLVAQLPTAEPQQPKQSQPPLPSPSQLQPNTPRERLLFRRRHHALPPPAPPPSSHDRRRRIRGGGECFSFSSFIGIILIIQMLGIIPLMWLGGPYIYDEMKRNAILFTRTILRSKNNDELVVLSNLKKVYKQRRRPRRRNPSKQRNNDTTIAATATATKTPLQLKVPTPIVVVGLPKAGTSSLFGFFHCSGLYSQHWYCCEEQNDPQKAFSSQTMADCITYNIVANLPLLDGCGNYDVITEMNGPRRVKRHSRSSSSSSSSGTVVATSTTGGASPVTEQHQQQQDTMVQWNHPDGRIFLPQQFYLQEFHNDYPSATFILNTRPVKEWVDSVLRYSTTTGNGNMLAKQFANEYLAQGRIFKLPNGQNEMIDFLTTLFQDHNQYIRDFCKIHTSHICIEIDIHNNKTGSILANTFFQEPTTTTTTSSSSSSSSQQQQTDDGHPSSSNATTSVSSSSSLPLSVSQVDDTLSTTTSSSSQSSWSSLSQLSSTCWGHYNHNQGKTRRRPNMMMGKVDTVIPNTTHGQERYRKSMERARKHRHNNNHGRPYSEEKEKESHEGGGGGGGGGGAG